MSTFDRKAIMEQADREHDEWVEKMRIKDKEDMYQVWSMLGFGLFCMSLGFIVGRSI